MDERSRRGGGSGRRQGVGVLILLAGRAGYGRRGLGPVCVVEGSKDKIATNEQDEGEKNSLIVHRICSISTGEKNPELESDWRGVRVIAPLENRGSGQPELYDLFFLVSRFSTSSASDRTARPT